VDNTIDLWSTDGVIETMEAILIECVEPVQNRKRGDNFSGVEYLQSMDFDLERAKTKAALIDFASSL
jgi:hypothetical protein